MSKNIDHLFCKPSKSNNYSLTGFRNVLYLPVGAPYHGIGFGECTCMLVKKIKKRIPGICGAWEGWERHRGALTD